MRTLYEIITDAKDGKMPTHEECYWAMLAYESMLNIEHRQLREELLKEKRSPEFVREMKAKTSMDMYKGALAKPPKEWLGWDNDPANPEYQKRRNVGKKLVDKFVNTQSN